MTAFIFYCCGVFWVIIGARTCFSAFRNARWTAAGTDTEIESSPASGANSVKRLDRPRPGGRVAGVLGGLYWIIVGMGTLIATRQGFLTRDMIAFVFPCVGIFLAVVGVWSVFWTFFSTAHQVPKSAIEMERASESSSSSASIRHSALGRQRLAGLFGGFLSFILGIAMVWFSDVDIGAVPVAVSHPEENSDALAAIVTQAVEREFDRQGHVGIVVGALAEDEETLLGFGARGLADSEAPDADTVFEIGSITKVFTGILLARMVENGELKLDDRIADLLPEGWSLSDSARDVTLRHLTTHTSGFPRLPGNLLGVTSVFKQLFGGDPYRDYSEEHFREALSTVELEFEPGTDRLYSNFAVGLLGFVLATQKGSDYQSLLASELLDPLGLTRTVITNEAWHRDHFAPGYRATLKLGSAMPALRSSQWLLPNHLAGAGGIRSTGSDMLKFLKANMGLVSTPLDAAIRLSHQELFREDDDRAMGMNWIRSFERDLSQFILWHNGGTGGYKSYLGFTEDRRVGVVVLSNTNFSVDDLGEGILKILVREYTGLKPVTKDGYAKIAPYTGVRWEDDRPIVRVRGRWSPLVSIDGIPIDRIMEFAEREFGDRARKRLAEDLVELLAKMGHEPDWTVTLGMENPDGRIERVEIRMTEENRNLVRE